MEFVEWKKVGPITTGILLLFLVERFQKLAQETVKLFNLGDRSMPTKAVVFEEMKEKLRMLECIRCFLWP